MRGRGALSRCDGCTATQPAAQLATTIAGVLGAQGRKNKRNSPPSSCVCFRACVLSGGGGVAPSTAKKRRKEEEGERE